MSDAVFAEGKIEEELRAYGVYASNTRGRSMEPLFRTHRDMVIIVPATEDLKKYDVPLYRMEDGTYVLHRIIGFYDGGYLIRGDNTFVTERIPRSAIVGVLSEWNRKGKHGTPRDRGYVAYVRIWCFIYPLRLCVHKVRRLLGKIYRFVFNRGVR